MNSPSSSSTSRSTPCVLGCCGPMFTVIVSVRSSGISNPESRIPNPDPRIPSPESLIPNPVVTPVIQPKLHELADRVDQRAVNFLNAGGDRVRHVHVHVDHGADGDA